METRVKVENTLDTLRTARSTIETTKKKTHEKKYSHEKNVLTDSAAKMNMYQKDARKEEFSRKNILSDPAANMKMHLTA